MHVHVAVGGSKHEDWSVFLAAGEAIAVMETSPRDGIETSPGAKSMNVNVK
jgi:hypothetical protein